MRPVECAQAFDRMSSAVKGPSTEVKRSIEENACMLANELESANIHILSLLARLNGNTPLDNKPSSTFPVSVALEFSRKEIQCLRENLYQLQSLIFG